MATALIGIGIPGSGKSTLLRQLAAMDDSIYLSLDEIREELTGDAHNQSRNAEAWALANSRLEAALTSGSSVVLDATHARHSDRLATVARCRKFADRVEGLWFVTSYRVCRDRNIARRRNVSEFDMGLMAGWLEAFPPTTVDGFDKVVAYDSATKTFK